MKETKLCPYCGKEILAVAKKCKHCGMWLDEPQPQTTNSVSPDEELRQNKSEVDSEKRKISRKKLLLIIGGFIIAGIIVAVLVDCINQYQINAAYDQSEARMKENRAKELAENKNPEKQQTLPVEAKDYEEVSAGEDDSQNGEADEVYDHWLGLFRIDGCIYRLCDSRAYLEFEKSGNNYVGTIHLVLGTRDEMERISMDDGELKGKIRARDTKDGLLVTLASFNTRGGNNYDLFSGENGANFKDGDQIFLITNSSSGYSTKAIGKMEQFFDGCNITTFK